MARAELLLLMLNRMTSLSCREKLLLAEVFDSAEALIRLDRNGLQNLLRRSTGRMAWEPARTAGEAEADAETLTRKRISYTFYWDADYPPGLREIYDPPFLLYHRGNLPDPERPMVAVVGTRRPTGAARRASFRFGLDSARHGIPVISGLARGIDREAHEGALKGNGCTLAVMACGIDSVYPKEHRRLAEAILDHGGALLSEYPPGSPALRYRFPQRNRIISGLSRAVVVVQAPERSGALITADFALDQGRDVFVHKEGTLVPEGEGSRRLSEDGAPVIQNAREVLRCWAGENADTPSGLEPPAPEEWGGTAGSSLARLLEEELSGEIVRHHGEVFRSY